MPHQKLDRAQVHTGLQKMGGEARTKAVNATALLEPRSFLRRAEDVPGFTSAQGTVLGSVGEKPDRRSVAFPILTQVREQVLRQDRIAVLPPLPRFTRSVMRCASMSVILRFTNSLTRSPAEYAVISKTRCLRPRAALINRTTRRD